MPFHAARECASQEGHQGPLLPRHVQCAYQKLQGEGRLTHKPPGRRMFR